MMESGDPDTLLNMDASTSCLMVGPVQPAEGVTLLIRRLTHNYHYFIKTCNINSMT